MKSYQQHFIDLALQIQALRFGDYTLKSGRKSPYFFNMGYFDSGSLLVNLGQSYANAITDEDLQYDMLFGLAYKGIPLVVSTAMALAQYHDINIPYAFNRKEAKDHGEKGNLIGSKLKGRVLIIDDVITAGTAIREALSIIREANATPCGIVIALDRQEKGEGQLSATQEIIQNYKIPVCSIIKLDHLIEYLQKGPNNSAQLLALQAYRKEYGVIQN